MTPVKTQAATSLGTIPAACEAALCTQSASRRDLQVHVRGIAGTAVVARAGMP